MSIHLDAETEALLERLLRQSGGSESVVLCEAVHRLTKERFRSGEGDSVYEQIADLVGAVNLNIPPAREHGRLCREAVRR